MKRHKKTRLTNPVLLTKTRYIGFHKQPVRDDDCDNTVCGLPILEGGHNPLNDAGRFIDAHKPKR